MEALKKKILAEGEVYEGNILKVDCFLNHQIDFPFMKEVADSSPSGYNLSSLSLGRHVCGSNPPL